MTAQPIISPFKLVNVFTSVLAIALYILDYSTDIVVAVFLSKDNNTEWWFALTVCLVKFMSNVRLPF